jgi:hypothetical protein
MPERHNELAGADQFTWRLLPHDVAPGDGVETFAWHLNSDEYSTQEDVDQLYAALVEPDNVSDVRHLGSWPQFMEEQ